MARSKPKSPRLCAATCAIGVCQLPVLLDVLSRADDWRVVAVIAGASLLFAFGSLHAILTGRLPELPMRTIEGLARKSFKW